MNFMNSMAHLSFSIKRIVAVTPTTPTYTVSQPSYLQFNYRFNTGDIVSNKLANYASGTAVYDASVNGVATIDNTVGNVAFGAGSLKLVATSNQFIELPSFTTNLNGFTISLWSKGTSATPNLGTIAHFSQGSGIVNDLIAINSSNFYIFSPSGDQTNTGIATPNNGSWNHYVWTIDFSGTTNNKNYGNWNIYINGSKYSTSLGLYYPSSIQRTFNVFGKHFQNNDYNTGNHDEFKMYNRSLSATEAKNLYYYNNTTLSFNSLTFNGSNSGVLSSGSYYDNTELPSGLTVDLWVKVPTSNTATGYQGIISKTGLWGIFMSSLKITVYNWGTGTAENISSKIMNDGLWHHVAVVFNPTVTNGSAIYIDGISNLVFSMAYSSTNTNPVTIGSAGAQQYFNGSIAFLRIWNTRKTAAQISQIYNKYIDPALNSDLIGFYSFNEGSGTTVNNNSSRNRYAFDLSNSPVWSSVDIPTIKRNQGVLPSIPDGCRGLYACKWVNSNYTGPILKLRKNASTTQDFYIDKTGTVVTTLPDASGTTFSNWMTDASGSNYTAYVNVWYDQSLLAKDASQNLVDNQPIFTLADGVSITGLGTSSRYLVLPNDNFAFSATSPYPYYGSYTFTYKISNVETLTPKANVISYNAVFLYGLHSESSEIYNAIDTSPSSGHKIYNGMWGNPVSSYDTSSEGGTVQPKTVITSTYAYTSGTAGSNNIIGTLNIYANGELKGTGPGSTNNILKKGDSMNTITPGVDTNFSNTIGTPRNEVYIQNFRGSLKYLSMFGSVLTTNDRLSMENIDDTIVNKNFSQSITGTSQIVYNETPVIGWTLSAVDNSNVTFLIASITDTTYQEGTMTSAPYTVLPSSITQFMVSKLTASGYSQSITQTIAITYAGYYTFSFYHAGRTGTNLYSSSHTLTVTLGTTTIVANLTTSTLGWQQYTGYLEFSTLDIGTKDLTFTFSSSSSLNSSYYITGVDFVFTSPLALYSSVPVGSVGLFACRWVNNLYTGPILKLRNGSTQTVQDFYMDRTGTVITTAPNGTGDTFANFIGVATAYMVTWYDQSGKGNHATISTGNYPIFDTATNNVSFNNSIFKLPSTILPAGDTAYTLSFNMSSATLTATQSYLYSIGERVAKQSIAGYISSGSVANEFSTIAGAFSPAGGVSSTNLTVTNTYNKANRYIYYNKSLAPSATFATTGFNFVQSTTSVFGASTDPPTSPYYLTGKMRYFSLYNTALSDQDRVNMQNIDEIMTTTSPFIVNGNFIDYITGTSQTVLNSTPVINWTLSTVDSSNVKFLISKTTDGTYARGASATAPFVTLPATITQFMVSQIITAGYSQTISQLVKVASAGTYTLTFYYAGRSTASKYTVNHTLTVSLGSTTLVTNLSASTSGWQLYTGTVTMATADIGIKNLKFTFYNGETFDSSYYITGVNVVYSSNLNTINTNAINNLIPGVTPWGIYDASLFTGSTLPEARGFTAKNATSTGTITVNSAISGNGTTASIPQIAGTNASTMLWPTGSLPQKFTIFSISRYVTTPTGNDKTIITNYSSTLARLFVHSHWNSIGSILGFYYGGWNNDTNDITTTLNNPSTNWASVCSRNASSASTGITSNYNFMANNQTKGTSFPSTDNSTWNANELSLCINKETYSANNDWDWALSYLVIYNSVLTDAQVAIVSTKLQNYLATGSMVDSYTTSISRAIYPSVPTGSVGLYACKWVNHNYKGPILKLRKSSDTTGTNPQNFYIDKTGTVVTTGADASGTTFANWLIPDSTAYVNVWYDQSLLAKDASQNTVNLQPSYDYTNKRIDFTNNANSYFALPNGTFPIGDSPYSVTVKHGTINNNDGHWLGAGTPATNLNTIGFRRITTNYINYWFSDSNFLCPTYADNNIVTFDNSVKASNYYLNNILTNPTTTPYTRVGTRITTSGNVYIGTGNNRTAAECLNGQINHLSIFNKVLTTTERQLMENIDDTVSNRNFGQPITGTSQLVSNDTPVYGWTLSAIDNTNSAFLIATTSDTTTYTRGTNVASPYVALPATITQFLVSQIVTAGSSHTVTQSVAITSAGYYSFTFYHAGRLTASSYSPNHTLTVTLGSSTVVSGLSTNASGWQQYAGVLTLATGDIGTKTLTFTFTSTTANSSFYVTGVDISLSGLIINTLSNNTTIIKDLIPGVTPWGIYDASLWNGSIKFLPEARGITARDASGSGAGTFTYNSVSGNGAVASIPQISGTTSSLMTWPSGSWPTNFTICAIGRFTALNNSRLFTSTSVGSNSFMGFGTNAYEYVYVDTSPRSSKLASNTNWSVICAKNTPNTSAGTALNTVLVNGTAIGTATGGTVTAGSQITLNGYSDGQSNWAFTYLVIYDSVLTDTQMASVSAKLQNYLNYGTMVTAVDPTMVFNYRFNTGDISGTTLANYATGTAVYDANVSNGTGAVVPTIDTVNKVFGTGSMNFPGSNVIGATTGGYIKLPSFTNDLNGLSICLWIQATSTDNASFTRRIFDYSTNTSTADGNSQNGIALFTQAGLYIKGTTEVAVLPTNLTSTTFQFVVMTVKCLNTSTLVGEVKLYVNGDLATRTKSDYYYPQVMTRTMNLLGMDTYGNDYQLKGKMDEFKLYKRVLNANEVLNLYNINDPGPRALLPIIPTGCVGLFACKWVNNLYTGPILRIRNGTSNAESDFYIDSTGTIVTTGANGTGQSFASWIGVATAFVTTWYDQSMQTTTKNATQSTSNTQPLYSYTNKQIDFRNNVDSYFNLPDGTVPSGNNSYTVIMKHGELPIFSTTVKKPSYLSSGNFSVGSMTTGFRMANDLTGNIPAYINYGWSGSQPGASVDTTTRVDGKCFPNNTITFKYQSSTATSYVNGAKINEATGTSRNGVTTSNFLGGIPSGFNSGDNCFNAPMYHLSIFNSALSDANRVIMENFGEVVESYTGSVTVSGGVYTFTGNGTITIRKANLQILAVGGGGAGQNTNAGGATCGGGGGGGFVETSRTITTTTTLTVTVGAGGLNTGYQAINATAPSGGDTICTFSNGFTDIKAGGGGGGGGTTGGSGSAFGGSGGGGGRETGLNSGGTVTNYVNPDGGTVFSNKGGGGAVAGWGGSGGGGGAGAVGGTGTGGTQTTEVPGNGGAGKQSTITGLFYAGGGGGGRNGGTANSVGGSGGGGAGGGGSAGTGFTSANGVDGTANTGGGGGGSNNSTNFAAGKGGSGVFILKIG